MSPLSSLGDVSQRSERNNPQSKHAGGPHPAAFQSRCKALVVRNAGLKKPEIPFINAIMNITPSAVLRFILVFPLKNYLNFVILTIWLSHLKGSI